MGKEIVTPRGSKLRVEKSLGYQDCGVLVLESDPENKVLEGMSIHILLTRENMIDLAYLLNTVDVS